MFYQVLALVSLLGITTAGSVWADGSAPKGVQPPQLTSPAKGSLAGEYGSTSWSAADLSRGSFSIPIGINFPNERGPMIYPFKLTYSPSQGLSEWGMGISADLSIRRYRVSGHLDFKTDDLLSPWGRLVRGTDGAFYSLGMSAKVRVVLSPNNPEVIEAYLPDGSHLIFGSGDGNDSFAGIKTPLGIYSWYLVEARNPQMQRTHYQYSLSAQNYLYLTEIRYGGIEADCQYRVRFDYQPLAENFIDYRSTVLQELGQRITQITVDSRSTQSSPSFVPRYSFQFAHTLSTQDPSFYLKSLQKTFASGAQEPVRTFNYNFVSDFLQTTDFKVIDQLTPVLKKFGSAMLYPESASQVDIDSNGLMSLELPRNNFGLLQHTIEGYAFQDLPEVPEAKGSLCRWFSAGQTSPRNLVRLRGPNGALEVVRIYYDTRAENTKVITCSRQGLVTETATVPGNWELGPRVRLVDLNQDGKPDLIRVVGSTYKILHNLSDDKHLEFSTELFQGRISESSSSIDEPDSIYLQDINGDGIADLIGRFSWGLRVWRGQGQFQFEKSPTSYTVVDTNGKRLDLDPNWNLLFADLTGSGIADLIVYGDNYLAVFFPQGKKFVQKSIPALKNYRNNKWARTTPVPALGDFSGSGNTQLVVTGEGQAHALEFGFAGMGLLNQVDDGKGNRLILGYTRAQPENGLGSRPVLLHQLTIETAGKGPQKFKYSYRNGVPHSQNKMLLGFSDVTIDGNSNHLEAKFYQDDLTPPLPQSSIEYDIRRSEMQKVTHFEYHSTNYAGIHFLRPQEESEGWKDAQGNTSLKRKLYQAYDNDAICPSDVLETSRSSSLSTLTSYTQPTQLAAHLGCWTTSISETDRLAAAGSNAGRNYQFNRDEWGHVLQFSMTSGTTIPAEGSRVLQDIVYLPDFRIQSIQVPGRGRTVFGYDANYRMNEIVDPIGVRVRAGFSDADLIASLTTERGKGDNSANRFEQNFGYDELDRLDKTWNNLSPSSAQNPLEKFAYRYASGEASGWISSLQKLNSGGSLAGDVFRETIGFQSGDGKEMGSASQTDSGWVMTGLTFRRPEDQYAGTIASKLAVSRPEAGLTVQSLQLGQLGSFTEEETLTSLGLPLEHKTMHQSGVQGRTDSHAEISTENLKLVQLENKTYESVQVSHPSGLPSERQDADGNRTRFEYDAFGKMTEILFPNQDRHLIRYDAQGRLKEIERNSIGKIQFSYYPGTDLVQTKKYLNPKNKVIRAMELTYDATGRVRRQKQISYGYSKANPLPQEYSHIYNYTYDGQSEAGAPQEGQMGFLTSVQGPDFTRSYEYRPDGKVLRQTVRFPGWKTLVQTYEYHLDGTVKSKFQEYRNDPSIFVETGVRVTQEFALDSKGRINQISINGTPLADLLYDEFAKLRDVQFRDEDRLAFHFDFDLLTRKVLGYHAVSQKQTSNNRWRLNDRGLLENETFGLNQQTLSRNYLYTRSGFIEQTSDAADSQKFQYDSVGLLRNFSRKGAQAQIDSAYKAWNITLEGAAVQKYELDGVGRLKRKPNLELSYGPSGRVERLKTAAGVITYSYDETGKRLLKRDQNGVVEAYLDDLVLTPSAIYQPIRVGGITAGVLENEKFIPLPTDFRGSRLEDQNGKLSVTSVYGERAEARGKLSQIIDFVAQGYDSDLQAYRMEQRDYDPFLKRFHTPDPYFFENPEKCVDSPAECNLYGYAKGNPVSFVDPTGHFAINPWTIGAAISLVTWAYHEVASSHVTGDAIHPTSSPIDFIAGSGGARLGSGVTSRANQSIEHSVSSAGRHSAPAEHSFLFASPAKAFEHFEKHGNSMMQALGKDAYSFGQYMQDANHVLKTGNFSSELNGSVKLLGGQGEAKAGFVGLTRSGDAITTFHVKTVEQISEKAPSLGWSK
jgi:RHS repeat-associated protein